MNLRSIFILVVLLAFAGTTYAQESVKTTNDNYKKLELSNSVINSEEYSPETDVEMPKVNATTKSAGISILLSLLLPGAGHYYIDRMDAGQYFLLGEGASWLGLVGVNVYSKVIRNNAETFAVDHAGVNKDGKNDQYFTDIGKYKSIYEYNNEKMSTGEFDKVYTDVSGYFWNWDNQNNQFRYDAQKGESERIKNTTIIFASALIVNRIASVISAVILTNQHNNALSNIRMNSELLTGPTNQIDGLQLNLIKQF